MRGYVREGCVTELGVLDEQLRALVLARVGHAVFEDYLSELRIVELNKPEVVLAVDGALARQVARSYGAALRPAALELAPGRRVLLHAGEHSYDLSESHSRPTGAGRAGQLGVQRAERMRQRTGKHGQPGVHDRLCAQETFRVPFSIAASLPRVAEQTPGRHTAERPVEYRGRYGRSRSPVTLTSFHHRLVLGLLRIAQAGQLGEQGVSCSVNSLLAAAFGVCSREQPGYARRVLPALMDLLCCDASLTACYQNDQGRTCITPLRELAERILTAVLVRCEDGQLHPLGETMAWDEECGWWHPTTRLARGGCPSMIVRLAPWVLEDLADPSRCVLIDTPVLHAVNPRRLFSYVQFITAPKMGEEELKQRRLPDGVREPPRSTFYRRFDLNATTVRDFGRHGQDLDRMTQDIAEDFIGARDAQGRYEHGLQDIDKQILEANVVYTVNAAQLWLLCTCQHGLRRGLPRGLRARQRRSSSRQQSAPTSRQARRQQAAHAGASTQPPVAHGSPRTQRGVPLIVQLARRRESSEADDGDG
jgi:hypothetical protein